jgi:hypothetical protein
MEDKKTKIISKSKINNQKKSGEPADSSKKVLIGLLIAGVALLVILIIGVMALAGVWYYKKIKPISSTPSQLTDIGQLDYENTEFGFHLKMTDSWRDYKVDVKHTDGGFGAAKIDFYLPSKGADYTDIPGYVNLFTINPYYIERWSEYQDFCKTAMCAGEEIGRNGKYVFTYYHINGFPPDDVPGQAMAELEAIIKAIEIFAPTTGYGSSLNSAGSPMNNEVPQDVTSFESRPAYDVSFAGNSVHYYNCKYRYSINYPTAWSTETATKNSIQVFFVGPSTRVKIESVGIEKGQSLASFADERTSLMGGNMVLSETVDWDGTSVVRSWFTHPDSQSLHWINAGRGMEIMAFGTGYNSQFLTIESMLSTLLVNSTPSECSSGSSSSSSSSSNFDCSSWVHPNGDIVYWWDQISEAERQCYISKNGYPPIQ